jgi:glutathione S-transferase/GST-like protein
VYLAEKRRLLPTDGRSLVMQRLMFQMAGIGPMMGQAAFSIGIFRAHQSVIDRYRGEVRRLQTVLDGRLADHEYLAGDYSITDIATWPWVRGYQWSGVSIDGLNHLKRWMDLLAARACERELTFCHDAAPGQ